MALAVLVVALETLGASGPRAQSNAPQVVIHVATADPVAVDTNDGSATKPLKTLAAGLARAEKRNQAGLASQVVVHDGVYRESLDLHAGPSTTVAPITITGEGNAVVTGSDVWRGWEPVSQTPGRRKLRSMPGLYRADWPNDWGLTALPTGWSSGYAGTYLAKNPVIRRREMVFVNDIPLTQVMSPAAIRTGTFFVSEASDKIYARVPSDIDLTAAKVEVATRPSLLSVSGRTNVTIDNLTFTHANTALDRPAVMFSDSRAVSVLNSRFQWNNWRGLGFSDVTGALVKATTANHNGVGGMSAFRSTGLRFEDTETSFNNWRGSRGWARSPHDGPADPSFIDFGAGQKFFRLRDTVFLRHRSIGNLSAGLWFDWDNSNVVLDELVLRDNLTQGLFVEASQGPFTLRNSAVCGNETGILIGNSENAVLEGNLLQNNRISQIFLAGLETRYVDDHVTGLGMHLSSRNWKLGDNTVVSETHQSAIGTYVSDETWKQFTSTLTSDRNEWLYEGAPDVFQIAGGARLDLSGWRIHTGQDNTSTTKDARSAECDPPPPTDEVMGMFFSKNPLEALWMDISPVLGRLLAGLGGGFH